MSLSEIMAPHLILLVVGVFFAFLVFNAYQPLRPTVSTGVVFFFAGWLTAELALHHLAAQVLATLALVSYGALDEWPGWIGLTFSVGSWAALLKLHEGSHLAGSEVSAVVAAHRATGDGAEPPFEKVRFLEVALPFAMRRPDVKRHTGIVHHDGEGHTLHVDVYHRHDKPTNAPVLVYVHGGGWSIGFKQYQGLPILYRLASEGWVCISVDYRLSPIATFPDHIVDVKRGIAWAKKHAREYGGDTSFVAVCGNSAGGHLAALAALTHDEPRLAPGFEEEDVRVDACVALYGVYDWTNRHKHWPGLGLVPYLESVVVKKKIEEAPELFALASPLDQVRKDAPPFFVIHGNRDSLVPVNESRRFVEKLRETSENPVLYAEVKGAQHAFDIFHSVRGRYIVNAISEFLRLTYAESRPVDEGESQAAE